MIYNIFIFLFILFTGLFSQDKGQKLFKEKKYNDAIVIYDSILLEFKGHDLSDEIYFRKYQIYLEDNNFEMALKMLNSIIEDFSYEILIDDALYNTAKIYDYNIQDKEKASEFYQQLILEHEGSIYISEARDRFRFLRGDKVDNEL